MFKTVLFILLLIPAICFSFDLKQNKSLQKTREDTLRIHPLGDSITRGKAGDTYRHYLKTRIENQLQIPVDSVGSCPHAPDSYAIWANYPAMVDSLNNDLEHEGWGGLKIHQIINSQNNTQGYPEFTIEDLVTDYPSDIILLMIGTNDIYFNYMVTTVPTRLNALISKILNNSTAYLIVASIPPTSPGAINDKINTYNSQVDSIVDIYKSQGKSISFVDPNSTMSTLDLLSDLVHPNSEGNRKIADCFFEGIDSVLTGLNVEIKKTEIPSTFKLYQNYPNPFNSSTKIKFYLPKTSFVNLKIFNIIGEEMISCINKEIKSGDYEYIFETGNLPSGIYFYKITAGYFSAVKRFLLIK